MIIIGKINNLEVLKEVDFGLYLDGMQYDSILLPKKYVPQNTKIGDFLDVFIYFDSEDRIIATTETPFAKVGECAYLECVHTSEVGAFMNWGLLKDLFVPFKEQAQQMVIGAKYIVYVYVDESSDRILASSKLNKHLPIIHPPYDDDDEVDIIVTSRSELGYTCLVDNLFWGLIYKNEAFNIQVGLCLTAYVRKVREDDRIDLSLQKSGYTKVTDTYNLILQKLEACNGFLPYHDKSSSDEIHAYFGISKKTFKMTIGSLYKDKKIVIEDKGIRLT